MLVVTFQYERFFFVVGVIYLPVCLLQLSISRWSDDFSEEVFFLVTHTAWGGEPADLSACPYLSVSTHRVKLFFFSAFFRGLLFYRQGLRE